MLLSNWQAKSRAPRARGDIGLGQAAAIHIGPAAAVVGDFDDAVAGADAERDIDRAAGGVFPLRLLAALDRLDGVLDQVGERLAYLAAVAGHHQGLRWRRVRSEEHTSELQSLMRISYAVFCLKKKTTRQKHSQSHHQ